MRKISIKQKKKKKRQKYKSPFRYNKLHSKTRINLFKK